MSIGRYLNRYVFGHGCGGYTGRCVGTHIDVYIATHVYVQCICICTDLSKCRHVCSNIDRDVYDYVCSYVHVCIYVFMLVNAALSLPALQRSLGRTPSAQGHSSYS